MLTVLQIKSYCVGVFNLNFCEHGAFKYFFICIMLPIMVMIFIWWVPDISRLFCRDVCQSVQPEKPQKISDVLQEIVSAKDIEHLITAAIIMGVQKFVKSHPKTSATFDNILTALKKTKK